MTQQKRLTLAVILLLLPLLALGCIVAKNEADLARAKTWRVKITGYDPRDLLSGHYLNFRFDWQHQQHRACAVGEDCCLCLNAKDGSNIPTTSIKTCKAAAACVSSLPMLGDDPCGRGEFRCIKRDITSDPEDQQRYYIPEESAPQLNALLADSAMNLTVDLKVTPSGRRLLTALYVNDIEWRDYLRQHPELNQPQATGSREHAWRIKIAQPTLYGSHLIFRLNWGEATKSDTCTESCALCLNEQFGTNEPAISYVSNGRSPCLERFLLTSKNQTTRRLAYGDFSPNDPQLFALSTIDTETMALLLAAPPKEWAIDVKTEGWGGAPEFGDIYIDNIEWREWARQHQAKSQP